MLPAIAIEPTRCFLDICNRLSHPARERVVGQEVNGKFLRLHGDCILCVRVVLVAFHILPNIAGQNFVRGGLCCARSLNQRRKNAVCKF